MNWYWNKENCFLVVTRHLLPVSLYQRAIQRWREVWRPVTRNYRSSLKYPPFQHFIFYNYLIICHFTQQYTSHHILRHSAHIKGKKVPQPLTFCPKMHKENTLSPCSFSCVAPYIMSSWLLKNSVLQLRTIRFPSAGCTARNWQP